MEQPNATPVKRRNYLAIIGLAAAAIGLLIAGIALPFHLLHHPKPAAVDSRPAESRNPEDYIAHPKMPVVPAPRGGLAVAPSSKPARSATPTLSPAERKRAVEEKFAALTHMQVMIIAQRHADVVTIQLKDIDAKLPLPLKQGIDSITLSYGKVSKSVPITQFIAADGTPISAGHTSPLVRVSLPARVKEQVAVHYHHADKKNDFSTMIYAQQEGAKSGPAVEKSPEGQKK